MPKIGGGGGLTVLPQGFQGPSIAQSAGEALRTFATMRMQEQQQKQQQKALSDALEGLGMSPEQAQQVGQLPPQVQQSFIQHALQGGFQPQQQEDVYARIFGGQQPQQQVPQAPQQPEQEVTLQNMLGTMEQAGVPSPEVRGAQVQPQQQGFQVPRFPGLSQLMQQPGVQQQDQQPALQQQMRQPQPSPPTSQQQPQYPAQIEGKASNYTNELQRLADEYYGPGYINVDALQRAPLSREEKQFYLKPLLDIKNRQIQEQSKAQSERRSKAQEYYTNLMSSREGAQRNMVRFNEARELIKKGNIGSLGALWGFENQVYLNDDEVRLKQLLLQGYENLREAFAGTGRVNQQEFNALINSQFSIQQTPKEMLKSIDRLEQMSRIKQRMADVSDEIVEQNNGVVPPDLEKRVSKRFDSELNDINSYIKNKSKENYKELKSQGFDVNQIKNEMPQMPSEQLSEQGQEGGALAEPAQPGEGGGGALSAAGRVAGRGIAGAAESMAGFPGFIEYVGRAIPSAGARAIGGAAEYLGAPEGTSQRFQELVGQGAQFGREQVGIPEQQVLPTPQDVRTGVTQRLTGQALEPKSQFEENVSDVISDTLILLQPGGVASAAGNFLKRAGIALTRSAASNLAKWGTEKLTRSPVAGEAAKIGTLALSSSIGGTRAIREQKNQMYEQARESVPEGAQVRAPNELRKIADYRRTIADSDIPQKNDLLQRFEGIEQKIRKPLSRGSQSVPLQEIVEAKQNLNEHLRATNLTRDNRNRLKKLVGMVNDVIDKAKPEYPDFYNVYKQADELTSALNTSDFIGDKLRDIPRIGKYITNPLAYTLVGGLIGGTKPALVGAGLSAARPLTSVLTFLGKSPTGRRLYADFMKASLKKDTPAIINSLRKLDKAAGQYDKKRTDTTA